MKATYIGPNIIRLKAEIDIDGSVIASEYLGHLPQNTIGDQVNWITQLNDYKQIWVKHIFISKPLSCIDLSAK